MRNGKGDKRRPMQITQTEFDKNWNNIFNGKNTKANSNGKITP
jgi:hypothetical protein